MVPTDHRPPLLKCLIFKFTPEALLSPVASSDVDGPGNSTTSYRKVALETLLLDP